MEEEERDLEIFLDEEDLEPDARKGYAKGIVSGFEVKAERPDYKEKLEGKEIILPKEKIVGGFEVEAEDTRYKERLEIREPSPAPEEEPEEEKPPEPKKIEKEEYDL